MQRTNKQKELVEKDEHPHFTPSEENFFNNLFSRKCLLKLSLSALLEINSVISINNLYAKDISGNPVTKHSDPNTQVNYNFNYGIMIDIRTIQTQMLFLNNEDIRGEFLLHAIKSLMEKIQKIYTAVFQKEPTSTFMDCCEKSIAMTILVSFNDEKIRNFLREHFLLGLYITSYGNNQTLAQMNGIFNAFCKEYQMSLEKFQENTDSVIHVNQCTQKMYDFLQSILKEYEKTTVPVNSFSLFSLSAGVIVSLSSIASTYALGSGELSWLTLAASLACGVLAERKFCTKGRTLNKDTIRKYDRTLSINATKVGKDEGLANVIKSSSALERAFFSIDLLSTRVISLECKPYTLSKSEKESVNPKSIGSVFKVSYSDNIDGSAYLGYSLPEAYDIYKKAKKRKSIKIKQEVLQPENNKNEIEEKVKNQNKSYTLSSSLRKQGLLFIEGKSKAFIKFGDYKDDIIGSYQNKNNQFKYPDHVVPKFLPKKKKFGGLKLLNSDLCELKLFSGKRIEFSQDGTVTNDGDTFPAWKPHRVYTK